MYYVMHIETGQFLYIPKRHKHLTVRNKIIFSEYEITYSSCDAWEPILLEITNSDQLEDTLSATEYRYLLLKAHTLARLDTIPLHEFALVPVEPGDTVCTT